MNGEDPKTEKPDEIIEMNFCNKLSVELMLTNMKEEPDQKNIVSSPMSINLLLNMLANGFDEGSTGRIKLMNALGFTTIDEINRVSSKLLKLMTSDSDGEPSYEDSAEHKELMDALNNQRLDLSSRRTFYLLDKHNASFGKSSVLMASGVWADRAFRFKPQFVEIAARVYQSCTESLDFSDEATVVEKVNSWAEKKTKGLIKDLVSKDSLSGQDASILILANSLYFKARWANDFRESMTEMEKFYLLDDTSIEVPFMKSTAYQYCRSLDGFKLLRLPYRSVGHGTMSKFSMYFFLPELKNGLKPLLKRFKQDPSLVQTKSSESRVNCITWIPKFNILFDFKPSDIMKTMGLDIQAMGLPRNMIDVPKDAKGYVAKVIQKSYIEVNEKGTKAASATYGNIVLMQSAGTPPRPPPVRFVVDHPFFFMIKDDVSGAVLFSGIVRNPLS